MVTSPMKLSEDVRAYPLDTHRPIPKRGFIMLLESEDGEQVVVGPYYHDLVTLVASAWRSSGWTAKKVSRFDTNWTRLQQFDREAEHYA
jgi:hypothetical protein